MGHCFGIGTVNYHIADTLFDVGCLCCGRDDGLSQLYVIQRSNDGCITTSRPVDLWSDADCIAVTGFAWCQQVMTMITTAYCWNFKLFFFHFFHQLYCWIVYWWFCCVIRVKWHNETVNECTCLQNLMTMSSSESDKHNIHSSQNWNNNNNNSNGYGNIVFLAGIAELMLIIAKLPIHGVTHLYVLHAKWCFIRATQMDIFTLHDLNARLCQQQQGFLSNNEQPWLVYLSHNYRSSVSNQISLWVYVYTLLTPLKI